MSTVGHAAGRAAKAGASAEPARTRTPAPGPSRRYLAWTVAAGVLVLTGIAVSIVAADAVADNQTDREHRSMQHRSAEVASTLQLAIQHENDTVVDAGGLATSTDLTRTSFQDWAQAARVLGRHPEMSGLAVLDLVPGADLRAFATEAESDPASPLLAPDGTFEVSPPGDRSVYCLVVAGVVDDSVDVTPAGIDYCANPLVKIQLFETRDTGRGLHLPYRADGRSWLAVLTPIYHGAAAPITVSDRRAAFAGWVVTKIDPTVLLERAVRDEPGMAVTLRYQEYGSDESFSYGEAAPGAETETVEIGDGWMVHTSTAVETGAILEGEALRLLLTGIAVSILLGLLVFVLGTGRERARRQLDDRTKELHHQALHDALTGLPNRALILDRAEQMLERNRRNHALGAALFLDVDDFKNINDTLGHRAGDQLLVAVAARLGGALRGGDTIGRMGGDEFVVLLDGSAADVEPELVAERLLDVLSQPFDLSDSPLPITVRVSIGIASGERANADDLLRDADVALYQAKAAGKGCFVTFDSAMHTDSSRRSDLEFDLRSALPGEQYRLVYQPIYRLDDLSMVGVEALLRWDHPTRGEVSPDQFIPILEETGAIGDVGRWVLHEACHRMASWHALGARLTISVNVSVRQLEHDWIVDDIREALQLSGLSPAALVVEVTESALMHSVDEVCARLHAIKALGVRIAIDDFGTGYSSLAYLRQFPVDCLKIDRMFTRAVNSSPESQALVDTLVQLGRSLGLYTLAEGVENAEEMDALREAEVDQAQGFLLARPLDPHVLEADHILPSRLPVQVLPG